MGFVGIGQQGVRSASGEMTTVSNFSYGGGASVPLFAGLRLAAELRQRRALSGGSAVIPEGMGTGRELRLSLTFGGRSRPARPTSPSRRRTGDVVLAGGTRRTPSASASAQRVLATGEEYLGVRYVYGGEDPRTGIDCSAFTQLVFRRNGVACRVPRGSR